MTAWNRPDQRTLVVDASVALKWQFDDEVDASAALALRDDLLIHRRVRLQAPDLFFHEIINGVLSAVRRKRLEKAVGMEAIRNLLAIDIRLSRPPADRCYELAFQYSLSAYDGAYVALAEAIGADFWTSDQQLLRAVAAELAWVRWIGEYLPQH